MESNTSENQPSRTLRSGRTYNPTTQYQPQRRTSRSHSTDTTSTLTRAARAIGSTLGLRSSEGDSEEIQPRPRSSLSNNSSSANRTIIQEIVSSNISESI